MAALVVLTLALGFGVQGGAAIALTLPPDFVVENAVPNTSFDTPTGIAFLPDGRMLVAEKRGRVWMVEHGVRAATPLWSADAEVENLHDRGLLGIAVPPDFAAHPYLYLLYTVDPDSDGADFNDNAFGRLTRYRFSPVDPNALDLSTRTVLFGTDWPHGPLADFLSHTIGTLRFGADGSLLVSIGEGASFTDMDAGGLDPSAFGPGRTDPNEDIGAFRAQDLGSLGGKVLRIDPETGHGYASNPFADGDLASVRSRVWAYGLRNPFRFTVRPGSGSPDTASADPGALFIGDVGWGTWEELDIARHAGINFGWPCREGPVLSSYAAANPAHHPCSEIGTPLNPSLPTDPAVMWHHVIPALSTPAGIRGRASIGGVFYGGTRYPAGYRGGYFFADYGDDWIRVASVDDSDHVTAVHEFGQGLGSPVDFASDPQDGDLVYVAIEANEVRRIRYAGVGGDAVPTAKATTTTPVGIAPHAATFSSAGSYDPEGQPLGLVWNFGDGGGSTLASPIHTYAHAGTFAAVLTVRDPAGNEGRDTAVVVVTADAQFPTTPVLDAFARANGGLGPSWISLVPGLGVLGGRLAAATGSGEALWSARRFAGTQEAYVTVTAATPTAPRHVLLLQAQGSGAADDRIEVRWEAVPNWLWVLSRVHGVTSAWGLWAGVSFAPGDRFGARAYANGVVDVFRNGTTIGRAVLPEWTVGATGGYIGVSLTDAPDTRLDDLGGGDAVIDPNHEPVAQVLSPADGSFFAIGDNVHWSGAATDAEDAPAALTHHWRIDIHHNNHVHPSSLVSEDAAWDMSAPNHDDGTGFHLEGLFITSDTHAASDTARVSLYPELDLSPSPVGSVPGFPGTTAPVRWSFRIRNHGRMPSPRSHWVLMSEQGAIAAGDTLVPARDSVEIALQSLGALAPGRHTLRVVVDSLAEVHEVNESDDALVRELDVVAGPGCEGVIEPGVASACLAAPGASATVPIVVHRTDARPVRGYSVRVHLSSDLELVGGPSGITEGSYLASAGSPTVFQVLDAGGGAYTVDAAVLGLPCGAIAASGQLFRVAVRRRAGTAGPQTVQVDAVVVRDCTNLPVAIVAASAVGGDSIGPPAITAVAATRSTVVGSLAGTNRVRVDFELPPGASGCEVYRAGFGSYPEYDDATGAGAPPAPTVYPPGAPWMLTAISAPSQSDDPGARGFWSYVVYTRGACGAVSPPSPPSAGGLDYLLGDVHDGLAAHHGDGRVDTRDISALGAHYGAVLASADTLADLDIGPTSDGTADGRPLTDDRVDFEDLMIASDAWQPPAAALAHSAGARRADLAGSRASSLSPPHTPPDEIAAAALTLGEPVTDPDGDRVIPVWLHARVPVHGVHLRLAAEPGAALVHDIVAGAWANALKAPALVWSTAALEADLVVLGRGQALLGDGEILRVQLQPGAAADARVIIAEVDVRDVHNRRVPVRLAAAGSSPASPAPAATSLERVYPNPMRGDLSIAFALARGSQARLALYDLAGRRVRTILDASLAAGPRSERWDGRDARGARAPAGLYLLRFDAAGIAQTRRVLLVW